jgi:2-polyprenyl-6-methoxyphenol hydroxylase-like FAD-dependent oxidoreductase
VLDAGHRGAHAGGLGSSVSVLADLVLPVAAPIGDRPAPASGIDGGVELRTGYEAVALAGDQHRVDGAICRVQGIEQQVAADLVVDASGRESRAPDWLKKFGGTPVAEQVVEPYLGYATLLCRPSPAHQSDWKALVARSAQRVTRAAGIAPIEGGNWLVTLAGFARDYPLQDAAGFMEFLRSLEVSEIVAPVQAADPLAPIVGYRRTTNRWRRFDRMTSWPAGFVVLGDAVCAFNPY